MTRRRRRNASDRDIDSPWQRKLARRDQERAVFATVGAVAGATLVSATAATLLCSSPRGPVTRTAGATLFGLMGAFAGALVGYNVG
jgi:hypothetical protein